MGPNPFREQQVEALKQMRDAGESLLPILGAGTSVALGVPTWQTLKQKIVEQIFKSDPQPHLRQEPSVVFDAALRRDPARYRAIVREQLAGMEGATTLLLRSLARMPLPVFATTNLDNHLEFAFRGSDKMLLPSRVGTHHDIPRLQALNKKISQPIIIKMHGTLELPDTWVFTETEYMKSYDIVSPLTRFLQSGHYRPLFIGFSLEDYEIRKSIFSRLPTYSDAFAFFRIEDQSAFAQLTEGTSSIGARIIPVLHYDEIAELLGLAFARDAESVFIAKASRRRKRTLGLKVGVAVSEEELELEDSQVESLKSALENAVDYLPDRDIETNKQYRTTNSKGQFVSDIWSVISDLRDTQVDAALRLVIGTLIFYPDVLFDRFIPGTVDHFKARDNDVLFRVLRSTQEVAASLEKKGLLSSATPRLAEEKLINTISEIARRDKFGEYGFKTRRALVQFLAITGTHPACRMPPVTSSVTIRDTQWNVMTYPICRFQVGHLSHRVRTDDAPEDLEKKNPLRPFVIERFSQLFAIVRAIREFDPEHRYTLLTRDEWKCLATNGDKTTWPWGDAAPIPWTHAALRFGKKLTNEQIEKRQGEERKESGLFPGGVNDAGIHDLVGNVYELTLTDEEQRSAFEALLLTPEYDLPVNRISELFRLCGGAWYHSPQTVRAHPIRRPAPGGGFRANMGLRLGYPLR